MKSMLWLHLKNIAVLDRHHVVGRISQSLRLERMDRNSLSGVDLLDELFEVLDKSVATGVNMNQVTTDSFDLQGSLVRP